MKGVRLDQLLVHRGLCESREKAQRVIRAGQVRVEDRVQSKPGYLCVPEALLTVDGGERFVSRGGEKLEGAFVRFGLDVTGRVCVDVGASTGGFTDCLLQHGAARVYALDVGKGQLHWKLRNDSRVVVRETINARHVAPGFLPEKPSFMAVDVSFISLTLVLPAMARLLASPATAVTLIKPQFEAGREQVEKGGVVRDPVVRAAVIEKVRQFGEGVLKWQCKEVCESPLRGPAGNVEYLAWWAIP